MNAEELDDIKRKITSLDSEDAHFAYEPLFEALLEHIDERELSLKAAFTRLREKAEEEGMRYDGLSSDDIEQAALSLGITLDE